MPTNNIRVCDLLLQVESSPFTERLLKKGYEVLYLTEAVDEYTIQSLPEFEGKKFQNVAKDGLKIGEESEKAKERREELEEKFEPLTKWLSETALKDEVRPRRLCLCLMHTDNTLPNSNTEDDLIRSGKQDQNLNGRSQSVSICPK